MKRLISLVLLFALSGPGLAVNCPSGSVNWEGVCAQLDAPKSKSSEPETNYASDEKPSKHPEAAWQRGDVHVVDVPNLAAEDRKMDEEKAQAEADGKRAAKIK